MKVGLTGGTVMARVEHSRHVTGKAQRTSNPPQGTSPHGAKDRESFALFASDLLHKCSREDASLRRRTQFVDLVSGLIAVSCREPQGIAGDS